MPNDLQHITPGSIIRADLLNTLIDGVKIARNLEHTGGTNIIAHRTNKILAAISHPCPVSDSNSN